MVNKDAERWPGYYPCGSWKDARGNLIQSVLGICERGALAARVKELESYAQRLESAGEALAAIIGPPGADTWAEVPEIERAYNEWTKTKETKP